MILNLKIQKALNKQVNMELSAFYSYLSMAAFLESRFMVGAAAWFKVQSKEELNHAMKLNAYIMARGGKIILTAIEAPQTQWASSLAIFEDAYAQEAKVSARINELMDLAKSEDDHATAIMLQWFVTEQVEEADTARTNVERFKFIKNTTEGIMVFDHELGLRQEAS